MNRHTAINIARRRGAAIGLIMLFAGLTHAGADVISPQTRIQFLQRQSLLQKQSSISATRIQTGEGTEKYFPVIIKLNDAATPLPDYVDILHTRGQLVLAMIPENRLDELGATAGVERLEATAAAAPVMVDAVEFCHASEIMAPGGSLATLTGKGVVTGLCDIGLQPNHLNFLNPDGTTRIRKMMQWDLYAPEFTIAEGSEAIREISTDDTGNTHATHVAGILAGNGGGTAYKGIANESEIVASVGPLADGYLLAGCEEIVKYAREQGKPAVINMSISSTIGPHDGTTLFNQYMKEICKDATVCISAGNDAQRKCYIEKTLTGTTDTLRTYIREYPSWSSVKMSGQADIWGLEGESFKVALVFTDFASDRILKRYDAIDLSKGKNLMLMTSSDEILPGQQSNRLPLPEELEGYIYLVSEINPENGRQNVALSLDYRDITTTDSDLAHYAIGLEVTGDKGTHIEIYTTERIFLNDHWDRKAMKGSGVRSVNDFCCGEGPICVGAMTSQNRIPTLDGGWKDYNNLTIGDMAYFSSYGTLNNGVVLPNIVAPGAQTVSSLSTPYLNEESDRPASEASFKITDGGKVYYWGSMQGTSMSSPFAAGVIALWLQEDPTLTPAEIKRIAIESADAPSTGIGNPQWGTGILNAARGLQMVRELAGISNVSASNSQWRIIPEGNGRFGIECPEAGSVSITVYNMAGTAVYQESVEPQFGGDVKHVDLSHLESGIYLIDCQSGTGRHTAKIAR